VQFITVDNLKHPQKNEKFSTLAFKPFKFQSKGSEKSIFVGISVQPQTKKPIIIYEQ